MSNSSSSEATSSETISSLRVQARPSRPANDRQQSYTHVFPAVTAMPKTPQSMATRKPDPKTTIPPRVPDENTRLLFGGLQWLLDQSTQPRVSNQLRGPPAPLSEKAIASFNERSAASREISSEPAKTAAWIEGQIKTRAAPPF